MSYGLVPRWRRSARSSIVAEVARTRRRTFEISDLRPGWLVRDSDGRRVGRIAGSAAEGFAVSRGWLSASLQITPRTISEVREGEIRLNVPRAWLEVSET